uniref:Evasin n=1 Tax=Amblyomma tuberculatum TaxID=48802 RepID=A0A6M2E3I6_9ACAR
MLSLMLQAFFLALIAAAHEEDSHEPAVTGSASSLDDTSNRTSASGEEIEEDYDDNYNSGALGGCYCPAAHLRTRQGNFSRVAGCIYICEERNCTVEHDYPCYDITLELFSAMEVNATQNCFPGMCRNGTCVTTGEKEECFK